MCCTAALRDLARSGEAGRLRRDAGISQRTMARALGVSSPAMSAAEMGRGPFPWHRAPGWLRVLRGLANHEAVSDELRGERDAA